METIKGTTSEGFEYEVSSKIAVDFRLVIASKKLSSDEIMEKVSGTYDFVTAVLGEKGMEKLVTFAVEKKGSADTEFILEQTKEILETAQEASEELKK